MLNQLMHKYYILDYFTACEDVYDILFKKQVTKCSYVMMQIFVNIKEGIW